MKINMGNTTLELSYVELLIALQKDVASDECMIERDKEKIFAKINELGAILWSYSA